MSTLDSLLLLWAGAGICLYLTIYRLRTRKHPIQILPVPQDEPKPVEGPLILQLLAGAGGGILWVVVLAKDLRSHAGKRDRVGSRLLIGVYLGLLLLVGVLIVRYFIFA